MAESFTKEDLINYCAEELSGVPKASIELLWDTALVGIHAALIAGMRVRLGNIGSLERVATPARKARNPLTGGVIDVQAGYRIKFRASRDMRG